MDILNTLIDAAMANAQRSQEVAEDRSGAQDSHSSDALLYAQAAQTLVATASDALQNGLRAFQSDAVH